MNVSTTLSAFSLPVYLKLLMAQNFPIQMYVYLFWAPFDTWDVCQNQESPNYFRMNYSKIHLIRWCIR